jgi:putative PIN family toxin of toxin-antitoxin system
VNTAKRKKRGPRLRAVLDTNVYISAAISPHGTAGKIVAKARAGEFVAIISPAIVNEAGDVLRRKGLLAHDKVTPFLKTICRFAEIVKPSITLNVVPDDPDDNRIIECAVEGKADLIVSRDNDLLTMKDYNNIPILHPADFLHTLGE